MNIKLIKMSEKYREQLVEMISEWKYDQQINKTDRSPRVIFVNDPADFDYYVEHLDRKEEIDGYSTNSVFFCVDVDRDRLIGAADIRHYLNDGNNYTGGHIGDGIRPSERGKGFATAMIGLALEECKKLGMNKVLMTCAKHNPASAKTIMNNGGVFESEVLDDGELEQRYWINLYEETVESERLVLRRAMPADYKEMAAWTQDERVYKYLLSNPVKKPEDAMNYLMKNDPNSQTRYIMIEHEKSDGHPVGIVACVLCDDGFWEISYNCAYDDWGKGYTTEAARALMEYVSEKHGATKFKAECAVENVGSTRVAEKLGMKYSKTSSYTKHDGSATFESRIYVLEKN